MIPDWTGEVVGRLHVAGISKTELAAECGYTLTHLSHVLNKGAGNDATRQKIMEALGRLEAKARGDTDGASED